MEVALDPLVCFRCRKPIPAEDWNRDHAFCAGCHAPLTATVFPALFTTPGAPSSGAVVVDDGEASCFYHPQKRAAAPCDQCGRFLCALCQIEFQGQNWCPRCMESGAAKGRLAHLDKQRALYDNIALATAILPALLVFPTILSAPVTLYLVIRYWSAPSSILPRSKVRFMVAAFLAIVEIAAWIWLIVYQIYRR